MGRLRIFRHKLPLALAKLPLALASGRLCAMVAVFALCAATPAQTKPQMLPARALVVVVNLNGRVDIKTAATPTTEIALTALAPDRPATPSEILTNSTSNALEITTKPTKPNSRIDLTLIVPARTSLRVTTEAGAVSLDGDFSAAQIATDTGTITADVPLDEEHGVKLAWLWTASRPRYFSELKLPSVQEKAAGTFALKGRMGPEKPAQDQLCELNFTTQRGVVLFNVDPAMVPTDLRERALTKAAKFFIESGNEDLSEAVRAVSPRMFGEYTRGLPPPRGAAPKMTVRPTENPTASADASATAVRRINVSVTDARGRAVNGLTAQDFTLYENGAERPITKLENSSEPFNLVLLLDVSGSVESRIDFIRKAARDFLQVASPQDNISIISFRDDIQIISDFTPDRRKLYDSLNDIEAGGSTALYDALGYALAVQLKPLRGSRTAVVIMSDGDDNRSFLPFGRILPLAYEAGALIYPLYMPSGLLPADGVTRPELTADPMRARYLTLTTRAEKEGRELARLSGGVYYPITQLSELQAAYEDVTAQLRTAYTLTYETAEASATTAPHLRVTTNRTGAMVRVTENKK